MRKRNLDLIERALSGDPDAFAKIYAQYSKAVYFLGLRMTKNEHDANDVVQETMLSLYENLPKIRNISAIGAFINRSAYNNCINIIRRNNRELNFEDGIIEEQYELDEDFIPEEFLESKETRSQVINAIDSLNEGQRAAVLMFYYKQMPVAQIASVSKVTEQVIKTRLFRARSKIQEQLNVSSKVKGVLSFTMATTVLTRLLIMESDAAFTPEVCIKNWQLVGKSMGYSNKIIEANKLIALTHPVSEGAFVAANMAAATGISIGAAKIAAIAVAVSIIGTAIVYTAPKGLGYLQENVLSEESAISKKIDTFFSTYNKTAPQNSQLKHEPSTEVFPQTKNDDSANTMGVDGSGVDDIEEKSTPFENYFKIEKGVVHYTVGDNPSLQQVFDDAGLKLKEGFGYSDIAVDYFEDVDFDNAGEYAIHVYANKESKLQSAQNAIIIIVKPKDNN